MRLALEILLFPILLLLSILIAFLKFIIKVSGIILGIISFLVFTGAVFSSIYWRSSLLHTKRYGNW